MRGWQQSVTLRLSIAFALLTTLVFAGLGYYFSQAADRHMAEMDAHELFVKLALVKHIGTQEKSSDGFRARLGDALTGEHGLLVAVDGPHGALFRWPSSSLADPLSTAGVSLGAKPVRLPLGNAEYRVVATDIATAWGENVHVAVARDIRHHTDFLDKLLHDLRFAVLAAAVLTAIVGAWLVNYGMRPMRDLARVASRYSAGQLAERLPERGVPREMQELVVAFNAMLGRLEESFSRLSDFSADLAHELRTPIHALRMQTEVSLSKVRDADDYRNLLESNLEEYERLSRMIADMLFLAKADHGLLVPQAQTVALLPLCERLIEFYALLGEHLAIRLSGDSISVVGDSLMLERAIGNVLVNAIHHTSVGGTVEVSIAQRGDIAEIAVSNTGPPIPEAALSRVFDRFVRLNPDSDGNGLGLAIARSIVLAHGGKISASSTPTKTLFAMRLPVATV